MIFFRFRLHAITLFIITLLFSCCDQLQSQTSQIRTHLQYLTAPELQGRYPGTRGDSLAANFIKKVFIEAGLKPFYDNYFQPFDFIAGTKISDSSHLVIGIDTLILFKDFVPVPISASAKIKASYLKVDLDSLVSRKTTPVKTPSWLLVNIPGKEPSLKEMLNIAAIADSLNAVGVLFVIAFDSIKTINLTQNPLTFRGNFQVSIPLIFIEQKAWVNSESKRKSKNSTTVTVDASIKLDKIEIRTQNVVGYIPGTIDTSKYIVIGAHYDHLGFGGRNSTSRMPHLHEIHPGADDNASGTVMIMNLASIFNKNKLPVSLIFVAFGAEEIGLIGSQKFVSSPPIPLKNIVAMLNFDMVGRLEKNTLHIGGVGTSPQFQLIIDTLKTPLTIITNPSGSGPSDHSSFYNSKIPILFFTTEMHFDYHTPYDTYDKINFEGMATIADYVQKLLKTLASDHEQITFIASTREHSENTGSRTSLKVTLGILPDITGGDNTGLKVISVSPGGLAEKHSIEKGDKILNINGTPIKNIYDYIHALQNVEKGKIIHLTILRDNQEKVLFLQP